MLWPVSRLDGAIKHFLGDGPYDALRSSVGVGRPRMHEMAIVKAFMQSDASEHATVLRDMNELLGKHGFYPRECWDLDATEDHPDA